MGSTVMFEEVGLIFSGRGDRRVTILDAFSYCVSPGSITAIVGPSGSGKSSVLNLACGLVRPTSGRVVVDETNVTRLSFERCCDLRRHHVGFVFQAFHLLPHLTAVENVALGSAIRGRSSAGAAQEAEEALREVGLAHRAHHRPSELSGGEQQRVALARVLAGKPDLLLADEPTGNLDPAATELVIAQLKRLHELTGTTVLLATHSPAVAAIADAAIELPLTR
jgi:putative ABC transport system ATP-binding protein